MNKKDEMKNKPLVLLILTFLFLTGMSLIPDGFQVWIYKVKKLDMFMDVKPDSLLSIKSEPNTKVITASLFNSFNWNGVFNSYFSGTAELTPSSSTSVQQIENSAHLKKFFEALKQASGKKLRILHFGDSAIEGDNISADFRKIFQAKFGGNGVGLVPITSHDVAFRTTTKLSFSNDWGTASLIGSNPEKLILGVNGHAFTPKPNSWVKMETTTQYGVKYFSTARIVYTSDKAVVIKYSFNDEAEKSVELKASKQVTETVLTYSGKAKSIKVTIPSPAKTVFYGISLEDGNGVYIDNVPLRGNSGVALRDLAPGTLKEFDKLFGYKLVVLNFGLNMAGPDAKDFGWYEQAMEKVIAQFKEAFPDAAILIMSVQDKSVKKGSKFVTDPSILKLVEAQKRIAQKSGVAFWNLFEAMGGQDSMNKWVDEGLASKDYTHVNLAGAKKIAEMLTEALLSANK